MADIFGTVKKLGSMGAEVIKDTSEAVADVAKSSLDTLGDAFIEQPVVKQSIDAAKQVAQGATDLARSGIENAKTAYDFATKDYTADEYKAGVQSLKKDFSEGVQSLKEDWSSGIDILSGENKPDSEKKDISENIWYGASGFVSGANRLAKGYGSAIYDAAQNIYGGRIEQDESKYGDVDSSLNEDEKEISKLIKGRTASSYTGDQGEILKDTVFNLFKDGVKDKLNGISEDELKIRIGGFQKEREAFEKQALDLANLPEAKSWVEFNSKVEKSFLEKNGFKTIDNSNSKQFSEFLQSELQSLSPNEQRTVSASYKQYEEKSKVLSKSFDDNQQAMDEFLDKSIKGEGIKGSEEYRKILNAEQKKLLDNESYQTTIKIYGLAESDLEKELYKDPKAIIRLDTPEFLKLKNAATEALSQSKNGYLSVNSLELSDDIKAKVQKEYMKIYDVEKKLRADIILEAAKLRSSPEYKGIPWEDFMEFVSDKEFRKLSEENKRSFDKRKEILNDVEFKVNANQAKRRWGYAVSEESKGLSSLGYKGLASGDVIGMAGTLISSIAGQAAQVGTDYLNAYQRGYAKSGSDSDFEGDDKFSREDVFSLNEKGGLTNEAKDTLRSMNFANSGLLKQGLSVLTYHPEEIFGLLTGGGVASKSLTGFSKAIDASTKLVGRTASLSLEGGLAASKSASSALKANKEIASSIDKLGQMLSPVADVTEKGVKFASNIPVAIGFGTGKIPAILTGAASVVKKTGTVATNATKYVGSTAKYGVVSFGETSLVDPLFNAEIGDAPTQVLSSFNAMTGLMFDAGLIGGVATGYKLAKGKPLFTGPSSIANKSMNNLMYGFIHGDKKEAVKSVQSTLDGKGIKMGEEDVFNLLKTSEGIYNSVYSKAEVNKIFDSKGGLYRFLNDNISKMDAINSRNLLTEKGVGIEIKKLAGISDKDYSNLELYTQMSLDNNLDKVYKQDAILKRNYLINRYEKYIGGNGVFEGTALEPKFKTEDNIKRNLSGFEVRKNNYISAKTQEEAIEALDELNTYVKNIQNTQSSGKNIQQITLTQSSTGKRIKISLNDLSEMDGFNYDDLLQKGIIKIETTSKQIEAGEYRASLSSDLGEGGAKYIDEMITQNEEVKEFIINRQLYFKDLFPSSQLDLESQIRKVLTSASSKSIFKNSNKEEVEFIAESINEVLKKIVPTAEIFDPIPLGNTKTSDSASPAKDIIGDLYNAGGDLVVGYGHYLNDVDKNNVINESAIYFSLGKNITNQESYRGILDPLIQKGSLALYVNEVKSIMGTIFELGETKGIVNFEKGKIIGSSLYKASGEAIKDPKEILASLKEITSDTKIINFVLDVLKTSGVDNQAHAGLLGLNLAYQLTINKKLIDELVKRANVDSPSSQRYHEVFSKILLSNDIDKVYGKVLGNNVNGRENILLTKQAQDKLDQAEARYISKLNNQKQLSETKIIELKELKKGQTNPGIRKHLDGKIKDHIRVAKQIDKLLIKREDFKDNFVKNYLTNSGFSYMENLAKSLSYSFLYKFDLTKASNPVKNFANKVTAPIIHKSKNKKSKGNNGYKKAEGLISPIKPSQMVEVVDNNGNVISSKPLEDISLIDNNIDKTVNTVDDIIEERPVEFNEEDFVKESLSDTRTIYQKLSQGEKNIFIDFLNKLANKSSISDREKLIFFTKKSLSSNPEAQKAIDLIDNLEFFNKGEFTVYDDKLLKRIISGEDIIYSDEMLETFDIIESSIKGGLAGRNQGDIRISQAIANELGIPNNTSLTEFINTEEGKVLRDKIDSLFGSEDVDGKIIYPDSEWLLSKIKSVVQDIKIISGTGDKTDEVIEKFINDGGFAKIIQTFKSAYRSKYNGNFIYSDGKISQEENIPSSFNEPVLKIDRMRKIMETNKKQRLFIFPSANGFSLKEGNLGEDVVRRDLKNNNLFNMATFGDKDSLFHYYEPPINIVNPLSNGKVLGKELQIAIAQEIYLSEMSYAEGFFTSKPIKHSEYIKKVKAIDLTKSPDEIMGELTSINPKRLPNSDIKKREPSQMSNYNTFDNIKKPLRIGVLKEIHFEDSMSIKPPTFSALLSGITDGLDSEDVKHLGRIKKRLSNNGKLNKDKFQGEYENYIGMKYKKDLEDGTSYAPNAIQKLRDRLSTYGKTHREFKDHFFGQINGFAVMGKTNFNAAKIQMPKMVAGNMVAGDEVHDLILIGSGSFKMGKKSDVSKKISNDEDPQFVFVDGKKYELEYHIIKGADTSFFKNASSDSAKLNDKATVSSSMFARFDQEYAKLITNIQLKDISKLFEEMFSSIYSTEIKVQSFSDISAEISKIVSATNGVGMFHPSVIQAKVDTFLQRSKNILTSPKIDSGSAVIRRADVRLSSEEILLGDKHPLVVSINKKLSKFIKEENKSRLESGLDAMTTTEIKEKRASMMYTTMYRYPVPSLYNLGIYRIKTLSDYPAGTMNEYSDMGSKQVVMSPITAFIKLEADHDGDKVFFAGLDNDYGSIIAKQILKLDPSTSMKDTIDLFHDGFDQFQNDFIKTEQNDPSKMAEIIEKETADRPELFKKYGNIVEDRLVSLEAKAGVGVVSATYRTLGLLGQYFDLLKKGEIEENKKIKNLNKYIDSYNTSDVDTTAKMMSVLQLVLDFSGSGRVKFNLDELDVIIKKVLGITKISDAGFKKVQYELTQASGSFNKVMEFTPAEFKQGKLADSGLLFGEINNAYKEFIDLYTTSILTFNKINDRNVLEDIIKSDFPMLTQLFNNINVKESPEKNDKFSMSLNALLEKSNNKEFIDIVKTIQSDYKGKGKDVKNLDLSKLSQTHRMVVSMLALRNGEQYIYKFLSPELLIKYLKLSDKKQQLAINKGFIKSIEDNEVLSSLNFDSSGFDKLKKKDLTQDDLEPIFMQIDNELKLLNNNIDELSIIKVSKESDLKTKASAEIDVKKSKSKVKALSEDKKELVSTVVINKLIDKSKTDEDLNVLGSDIEQKVISESYNDVLKSVHNDLDLEAASLDKYITYVIDGDKSIGDVSSQIVSNIKVKTVANKNLPKELMYEEFTNFPILENPEVVISAKDKEDILLMDSVNNIVDDEGLLKGLNITSPKFIPKIDYASTVYELGDEGLLEGFLKESKEYDAIRTQALQLTLFGVFRKYLPEFTTMYEGIRSLLDQDRSIFNANYYSVSQWGKQLIRNNNIRNTLIKHGIDSSNSSLETFKKGIDDALLGSSLGEYKLADEDYVVKQLTYLFKDTTAESLPSDPEFIKQIMEYGLKTVAPVVNKLNLIQEIMKSKGSSIGSMYNNKGFNIIEDVLQASKSDPTLSARLMGYTDRNEFKAILKATPHAIKTNIWDGTVDRMSNYIFGREMGQVESVTTGVTNLVQTVNYSAKYGALSLITGNGIIAGMAQMIPNTIELVAYMRAYNVDMTMANGILQDYGILKSENTIKNGTGSGSNLDSIAMLEMPGMAVKLLTAKTFQLVGQQKYAQEAGEFIESMLFNPLGFFDAPIELMRKKVAIGSVMKKMNIQSRDEFDQLVREGGIRFKNRFESLVAYEFAVSGGGAVSSSGMYRKTILEDWFEYLPDTLKPFGAVLNRIQNFLMGWANHKVVTAVEPILNMPLGILNILKGNHSLGQQQISSFARFSYMALQQSMMVAGLYMQMQSREKDPNDLQTFEGFYEEVSNLAVGIQMIFGKYINAFIDTPDDANVSEKLGFFTNSQLKRLVSIYTLDEFMNTAYKHYSFQSKEGNGNFLESIQFGLNQHFSGYLAATGIETSGEFYTASDTSSAAYMLITSGTQFENDLKNRSNDLSWANYRSHGFISSMLAASEKMNSASDSSLSSGIINMMSNQIIKRIKNDSEISKLYFGGQLGTKANEYNIEILFNDKLPKEVRSDNIDNLWKTVVNYAKYSEVDKDGKLVISNSTEGTPKERDLLEKRIDKQFEKNGIDITKVIAESSKTADFQKALSVISLKTNISTPVLIAYMADKDFSNARTDLNKSGKISESGYKQMSDEAQRELKKEILVKYQSHMNLVQPYLSRVSELHVGTYYANDLEQIKSSIGRKNSENLTYIEQQAFGIVNREMMIKNNILKGDTNVARLGSQNAIALKYVPNSQAGADYVLGVINDIQSNPFLDKKAKLANTAGIIIGLNKSQYGLLKDNKQFKQLTEDSQAQLANWMYRVSDEALSIDSNSLGNTFNRAYAKKSYEKKTYPRYAKTLNSGSNSGMRPNFADQFKPISDMLSGKQGLISSNPVAYTQNNSPYASFGGDGGSIIKESGLSFPGQFSKDRIAYYKFTLQNTFYGYDSKGTLNPFNGENSGMSSGKQGPSVRGAKIKRRNKASKNPK